MVSAWPWVPRLHLQRRLLAHVGSTPDFEPLRFVGLLAVLAGSVVFAVLIAFIIQNLALAKAIVLCLGIALLCLFAYLIAKGDKSERSGLIAMILTAQTILFFQSPFYPQMSTSLTCCAAQCHPEFSLVTIPPGTVPGARIRSGLGCSTALAILYSRLGRSDSDLSVAGKFAWGSHCWRWDSSSTRSAAGTRRPHCGGWCGATCCNRWANC